MDMLISHSKTLPDKPNFRGGGDVITFIHKSVTFILDQTQPSQTGSVNLATRNFRNSISRENVNASTECFIGRNLRGESCDVPEEGKTSFPDNVGYWRKASH
jgi:hypothetical protein